MEHSFNLIRFIQLVVFGTILAVSSCMGFFDTRESVDFNLEEFLEKTSSDFSCNIQLCYPDSSLNRTTETISAESLCRQPYIHFDLKKNRVFPLVVTDSSGNTYGAIYPFSKSPCSLDAFAAEILLSLYSSSNKQTQSPDQIMDFVSKFNWQRFMEECASVQNPELLDRELIVKKIAAGSFTKADLKPR